MNFNRADSQGRAEGIIRLGTITEIDNANRKVRVKSAGLTSGWLPYPSSMGNNFIAWTPIRMGQQVVVGCPSGDFAQGVILQTLYTDSLNSPSTDADTDVIQFNDGTIIKKDASSLTIDTPCSLAITAPNTTISSDTTINGSVTIVGSDTTINSSVTIVGSDLTHNGVNVGDTHKHGGIIPGPEKTGTPV